ncbi:MAG: heavy metal-binding domain-containing protein [Kofleriaceae bacterium]
MTALSELGVTEFLTLQRAGFLPCGLVVGTCVYSAGSQYDWNVTTGEITALTNGIRSAREYAIQRMNKRAKALNADGVVDVRLDVEHHLWRGGRQVAKAIAVGTAVQFNSSHAPPRLRNAPSLRLAHGEPFSSDLSGGDFVTLLAAGYRPVAVASGTCVYGLDPRTLRNYRGRDEEIREYTQAFFEAREKAMEVLQKQVLSGFSPSSPDHPVGVVGMTVSEQTYGGAGASGPPIVEFSAIGTAVALLADDDPRRTLPEMKPVIAVPLDR